MRTRATTPAGTVHRLTLDSKALKGNLLGDPTQRIIDVYVPHGHDGAGLPLLVDIVGFTAGGPAHTNWKNFGENVPERLDRLIDERGDETLRRGLSRLLHQAGRQPVCQFSVAMGHWADFLIQEAVPFVERSYRLRRRRTARAVRQKFGRLWRDGPCPALSRFLGGAPPCIPATWASS